MSPTVSVDDLRLSTLVTKNSAKFFEILEIETHFMDKDPELWSSLPEYVSAQRIVKNLQVVNDHAERAIKLVQELNKKITKDEDQLQNLIVTVSDHKKKKNA